jgi:hypothetical protein
MSIFDYYKALPGYKKKQEFRKKVMEKCDISYPTFQMKVHSNSWNKLEREAVEQIIAESHENNSSNSYLV